MNKNLKKITSMLAVVMLCSTSAYAGGTYKKQTVIVPKLGGAGSSAKETKATTGRDGNIMNPTVGNNYTVTAQLICGGSPGNGVKVTTGTKVIFLPSKSTHKAGQSSHILFKNKIGTLVDVQVVGQMRTN